MTVPQLGFILLTVLALSAGQILFKIASTALEFTPVRIAKGLLDWRLALALVVYAAATLMWLYVLKITPLRVAYPFAALAFVLVPLLAGLFLGEAIRFNTLIGSALILAGIWVSALE